MANRRIVSAAEAVFVGPTGAGTISQLHRIQSVSQEFSIAREAVQQFGQYGSIDRVILNPPTVSLDISYILANVYNESKIGLTISSTVTALSGILAGTTQTNNYYIKMAPDGTPALGYAGTDGGAIAIGNGVIGSYTTQAAVGSFATSSFTVQGLNARYDSNSSVIGNPAINSTDGVSFTGTMTLPTAITGTTGMVSALQPGDITVDIGGAGLGISGICPQSYNMSFDLGLEPLICLGSKFPTSREITFPVECRFTMESKARDFSAANLADFICLDPVYDLIVTLRSPSCGGGIGAVKAKFSLKGAKLDSQTTNSTLGADKTVTTNFTSQIGGPAETTVGLFIEGDTT